MTYYVTHVKYDENDDVIEKVRLSDASVFTKKQMIVLLNNGSEAYTYYDSHVGDHIHIVDNEYLRTDGNHIKRDNLGNLPRF